MSYAHFYTLVKKSGQDKEQIIGDFTEGRTTSIKDLSSQEYNQLCDSLRRAIYGSVKRSPKEVDSKENKIRRAIIGCFHTMKYDNAPAAAKAWCEKMGVGSGKQHVKKGFNQYTEAELMKLLRKAERAVADFKLSTIDHLITELPQ